MIAVEPEGSKERFLTKKCIPFITGFGLVAGIFMFGAGVGVMNKEIVHAAISSVHIQTAPILLLVAGILCLLVTCLGIYFIKRKLTLNDMGIALIVFMGLLALAALLALIAGGFGIGHTKKVKNKFEEDLQNGMENYGRTGYETMVNINRLQKQDKCCGVFIYADWRATVYGGHRYDRVPDSCCKMEEYGCGFKFKDEATLNKRGCASIALDKMTKHLMIVGVSGILYGIAEAILFIVILSCYICYLCNNGPQQEGLAAVNIEYHKTGTPSDDDVPSELGGGDEMGAQGGSASSTQGHDAPVSPVSQGSRSGAKATLPPLKARTAAETSEETRKEEQGKKQREKSKQGKG